MKSVLFSNDVTLTDTTETCCRNNNDATAQHVCFTELRHGRHVHREFSAPTSSRRFRASGECRCVKNLGCECGNSLREILRSATTSRSSIFKREDNFPREAITFFISAFPLQPCPWIFLSKEVLVKVKRAAVQREMIDSVRSEWPVKEGKLVSYTKELAKTNIYHESRSACLKKTFKKSDVCKGAWCPRLCDQGDLLKFMYRCDAPKFSKSTRFGFVRLLFSCLLFTTLFPNVRLADAVHHGNSAFQKRHLPSTITLQCKNPIKFLTKDSSVVAHHKKTRQLFCEEHREVFRDKNRMLRECAGKNNSKCCKPVEDILETDYTLKRSYDTFLLTITKYATPHNYSVNWSIGHCKDTYKKWICAVGHKVYDGDEVSNKSREKAASNCLHVWARCPFFRVHNHTKLYGGQSAFLCTGYQSPESPKWGDCQNRPGKPLSTSSVFISSATEDHLTVASMFTNVTSTPWTFVRTTSHKLNVTAFDLSDHLTTSVSGASRHCLKSSIYFSLFLNILILSIQFFNIPFI